MYGGQGRAGGSEQRTGGREDATCLRNRRKPVGGGARKGPGRLLEGAGPEQVQPQTRETGVCAHQSWRDLSLRKS